MPVSRPLIWAFRVVWAGLALAVGPAVGQALDGRSHGVRLVVLVGVWAVWAAGLLASLVPLPGALTAIRVLAPAAPAVAVAAAAAGAGPVSSGVAVAVALVAAVFAFTAEIGNWFVQSAAYGDEARFLVRPPGPLLLGPIELLWALLAAGVGAGPLLLASRQWVVGGVITALAVAMAFVLVPRFHRLSLRWLVFVPAGFVVRDPLVLADTAMLKRPVVGAISLAPSATTALDLTAGALGPAIEISLAIPGTVMLAGTLRQRQGHGVDATALLVSPSRPGRVVAEAVRRGYAAVAPATTNTSASS